MKTRRYFTWFLTISILGAACAKQRPIVAVKDPEKDKIEKAIFYGMDSQTAAQVDRTQPIKNASWLSKVTVVKTNSYAEFVIQGFQSEARLGHFEFTHDKLKYYDDVLLSRNKKGQVLRQLINEWDITHHDVKLSESDGNVTNKEEDDQDKTWDQKRYFKIDFSKAVIDESASFPYMIGMAQAADCWEKAKTSLLENSMQLSSDYISFIVAVDYKQNPLCLDDARRASNNEITNTVHYRYSFMKFDAKSSNYKAWLMKDENDDLNKKFGYFQTRLQHLDKKYEAPRDKIFANRWNPDKEHNFYFTKDFPEQFKWIFTDEKVGIFPITNRMFEKNGLKVRFYIRENTWGNGVEKEFGDIRYSFINFVEEPVKGGILGLGPSDSNPLTGEIISANLNVYSAKMKQYIEVIRLSLAREKSKYSDSSLYTSMKQLLGTDYKSWAQAMDPASATGKAYYDMLPDSTYSVRWGARYTKSDSSIKEESVFKFKSDQQLKNILDQTLSSDQSAEALSVISDVRSSAKKYMQELEIMNKNRFSKVITPIDTTVNSVKDMLASGMSPKSIVDAILYRTAIHEFGHNLSLRHNFYGTMDKRNFPEVREVVTKSGQNKVSTPKSSSVMDYTRIRDELEMDWNWEPYDIAALLYLYSDGKIDEKNKLYLYCTDEHSVINAMCQKGDYGTSPSEVLMSLIENYESIYEISNKRRDVAFWDTRGYRGRIFSAMWDIKKFMMLGLTGLDGDKIDEFLRKNRQGEHPAEWQLIKDNITLENLRTVRLALAFYNAVLQQSTADRPYEDTYDEWNHEKKVQGILPDKIFAAFFLMGDEAFDYDPNRPVSDVSFLSIVDHPEIATIGQKVMENLLTIRVDMKPWFISLGRALFALTATDFSNRGDASEIEKIRVAKYDPNDLTKWLGIDVNSNKTFETDVKLGPINDPYFKEGAVVGYAVLDGKYYVADRMKNPIAYNIIEAIQRSADAGASAVVPLTDLRELHSLYGYATGMIRAQ